MRWSDDWVDSVEIISEIEEMVLNVKLKALEHFGHTHLYSGHDLDVSRKLSGISMDNGAWAIKRAARLKAVLIDATLVGKYLNEFKGFGRAIISGKGLTEYFNKHPYIDDWDRKRQSILPWRHASYLFALAS